MPLDGDGLCMPLGTERLCVPLERWGVYAIGEGEGRSPIGGGWIVHYIAKGGSYAIGK